MATLYEILVFGYMREEQLKIKITIPPDVSQIILIYLSQAKLLRFCKGYKDRDGLELSNDCTMIKRVGAKEYWHRCCQIDTDLIYEGVHCWRVCIYNPVHTDHVFWGIRDRKEIPKGDSSVNHEGIWGQISNGWTRRNGQDSNRDGFDVKNDTKKYKIDMLFDADYRTLEIGVIDKSIIVSSRYGPVSSSKQLDIPKDKGFVPHFQMYRNGTSLQVAQIDPSMFLKQNAFVASLFK